MIELLIGFLTVIGSIASVYSVYVLISSRRVQSWRSVEKGVVFISCKIKVSGWEPDVVVGLGVGGSVVGAMLAGSLGRKRFLAIDRRYRWAKEIRKTYVDTPADLKLDPTPQRVLLVVGEIYSGETIEQSIKYIRSKVCSNIKTAALYVSENSNYYPDFYRYRITKRIKPPWRLKGYLRDSKF